MERHKLFLLKTAGTIWKQARCSSAHIHEVSKTLSFVFFSVSLRPFENGTAN
jgi:hypothetical protein